MTSHCTILKEVHHAKNLNVSDGEGHSPSLRSKRLDLHDSQNTASTSIAHRNPKHCLHHNRHNWSPTRSFLLRTPQISSSQEVIPIPFLLVHPMPSSFRPSRLSCSGLLFLSADFLTANFADQFYLCYQRNNQRANTPFKYFPVNDAFTFATSSGVPCATTCPPLSPPSGPRSIK